MTMTRPAAALAAIVLLLGLAGCAKESADKLPGGSVKPSKSAEATPGNDDDAFLRYARCLREQGLDVADPTTSGGIVMPEGDPALVEQAQTACASQLPSGGQDVGGGAPDQAALETALQLAACLRSKGHDFPDPTLDAQGRLQLDPPQSGGWEADAPACLDAIGAGQ